VHHLNACAEIRVSDFLGQPSASPCPLAIADLVARAGEYTDISFREGQVSVGVSVGLSVIVAVGVAVAVAV